jgi:hypothetical protein
MKQHVAELAVKQRHKRFEIHWRATKELNCLALVVFLILYDH